MIYHTVPQKSDHIKNHQKTINKIILSLIHKIIENHGFQTWRALNKRRLCPRDIKRGCGILEFRSG